MKELTQEEMLEVNGGRRDRDREPGESEWGWTSQERKGGGEST